jgi:hypothetical protein
MASAPRFPHHAALYRYWDSKRAGRPMPSRRDFDPCEVPALLPHLMIVDKFEGRFRYRLVGTTVADHMGRDLTGLFVGDNVAPPEYAAAYRAGFEHVWTSGRPVFATSEYEPTSGNVRASSRLLLPLGEDGRHADRIVLSGVSCLAGPRAEAAKPYSGDVPGRIGDSVEIAAIEDVLNLSAMWERKPPTYLPSA